MTDLLLQHGSLVDEFEQFTDQENYRVIRTALHSAIQRDSIDIVALLLHYGANKELKLQRDSEELSCFELCTSIEMKNLIRNGWSTQIHKYYPKRLKQVVVYVLLVAKRSWPKMPKDVLYYICNKVLS